MNTDSLLESLQCLPIESRRSHLRETLLQVTHEVVSHEFNSPFGYGCNFVSTIKGRRQEQIVLTAHYDGHGTYDNAGGVLALLLLLERSIEERSTYTKVFVFTDQEESFQQGSSSFLRDYYFNRGTHPRERIVSHFNIDGFGVGKHVIERKNNAPLFKEWQPFETRSLFLMDNDNFSRVSVPTYHFFSCQESDSQHVVLEQSLTSRFSKYLDESWCLKNVDTQAVIAAVASKLWGRISDAKRLMKSDDQNYEILE